jgi:predicted acylesterase/phospholipase RssA
MPKRLAITIAGAVSLGSYEAGVLFEVLEAVQRYNNDPITAADDRIVIDVLSGASAGEMCALRANINETFLAAQIREQGEKEMNHDRGAEGCFGRAGFTRS